MLPSEVAELKTDAVRAKARANLPEIQLVSAKIGPIMAGNEVQLERWQAEILAEWGIVEMPSDSNTMLSRAFEERDRELASRSLVSIEDPFHTLPGIVGALAAEGLLTQKTGAVKELFEDLVTSRTNKITRCARMGQDPGEALTPEETWLYWSLRRVFDTWRKETDRLLQPPDADRT